jgi:hypothetical protein
VSDRVLLLPREVAVGERALDEQREDLEVARRVLAPDLLEVVRRSSTSAFRTSAMFLMTQSASVRNFGLPCWPCAQPRFLFSASSTAATSASGSTA